MRNESFFGPDMLTIIMYHYVRDLPRTRHPRIKGLLTLKFDSQLNFFCKHYTICTLSQVIAASQGEEVLPENSCVLTFDDGLADHYQTVFPRLKSRGLVGAFFPPARPVEEKCVLDVHKIHFVLAAADDFQKVMQEVLQELEGYRNEYPIADDAQLQHEFAVANRFDQAEVIFVKRLLQWVLPQEVRRRITARLFERYVSQDEAAFAQELYMDMPQLCEMAEAGMEIGGHGYNHLWLGQLSRGEQEIELRRTCTFLGKVLGKTPDNWVMCYPFGSYNATTIELVSTLGCAAGLTTKVELADLSRPLELGRWDTNDVSAQLTP